MKNSILKTTLISSLLASSSLLANDTIFNSVGINLGTSYTSYDHENTNGSIDFIDNNADKSFNSIEIYTTLKPLSKLCKDNSMRPYVSYTYSQNSDLKHQYLLAGINRYYTLSSTKLQPYVGVVAGYGQMEWRYDPLNSSQSKNVDANSFIAGIQTGTTYPINDKLSLNFNAKYLLHNYETDLKTTNALNTIEHKDTASIAIGLEYSF